MLPIDAMRFRVGDIYIDELEEDYSHDVDDYLEMQPFYLEVLTLEQYESKDKNMRGPAASRYSLSDIANEPASVVDQHPSVVRLQFRCQSCGRTHANKFCAGYRIDLIKPRKCEGRKSKTFSTFSFRIKNVKQDVATIYRHRGIDMTNILSNSSC